MSEVRGHWVRRLCRPEGAPPIESICFAETLEQATEAVGAEAVDWAVATGYETAVRCLALMPELGRSEGALRSLRLGTESAALRVITGIAAGGLPGEGATPEVVVQMRDYVHRRIPLDKVWASIRQGHSWFAEYFMAPCRAIVPVDEQPDQLELVSRTLFAFVNEFAEGVGDAYRAEHERWITSKAAAREEVVRAVLEGTENDIASASSTLRYDLHAPNHLCLVLCQTFEASTDTRALQQAADEALRAMGAAATLMVPIGRSELWAWGASSVPIAFVCPPELRTPRITGASGSPGRGLAGFRRSYLDAMEAARVALISGVETSTVTRYDDVALLALLSADLPRAGEFVQRELGQLATEDSSLVRDLRRTLLTYLENRRSPQATAAHLHVAKNTVVYRVKRAEELLGHPIDERQPEVWAALLLSEAFGVESQLEEPILDDTPGEMARSGTRRATRATVPGRSSLAASAVGH